MEIITRGQLSDFRKRVLDRSFGGQEEMLEHTRAAVRFLRQGREMAKPAKKKGKVEKLEANIDDLLGE